MENKKLSRRQRAKLRDREEMLGAALALFSEKGYHGVSMRQIAEKADFAIPKLYKFFKNKEDIYKVVILEQVDRLHDGITKAIEEPEDEVEKLRNYVKAKGAVFRANASAIRLYFAETGGTSFNVIGGLNREIRERYGHFLQALASVFESGIKVERFKKIADPYHLAVALDSFTNANLLLWLEAPERHPYPEDPDMILNILFKRLVDP